MFVCVCYTWLQLHLHGGDDTCFVSVLLLLLTLQAYKCAKIVAALLSMDSSLVHAAVES